MAVEVSVLRNRLCHADGSAMNFSGELLYGTSVAVVKPQGGEKTDANN
jgi:hypothetical protein